MAASTQNVYVGSETGLLKGIAVAKGSWRNLNNIDTPNKSNEITCLCWNHEDETNLIVGLRCHKVANFDIRGQVLSDFTLLDQGKEGNLRSVSKFEDSLITAYDNGLVYIQQDDKIVQEINTGSHLQCLSRNKNIIATGGKEAELKLFDISNLESATPVFQAKNVRNDWLNLRVPVWVTGINILAENKIVTCTGHHQVRMYDPSVQRRPVLDMTFDEHPITAMSSCSEYQVIVGNTQGSMGLLDVRKGKLVHRYKGFAGSIRSVQCHSSLPVVASCGLDRFFRVHDINSKQLLHKMYLKSKLNCLLMSKYDWTGDCEDSNKVGLEGSAVNESDVQENDDNDDDVWDKMEVVKTRTLKRKGTVENEDFLSTKKSSMKKEKKSKSLKKT